MTASIAFVWLAAVGSFVGPIVYLSGSRLVGVQVWFAAVLWLGISFALRERK
jgi:hypothetical protein